MSPWFRENFLITRVKRPYLSFEPVSYKVSTMTGTELKGEQNLPFQNFGCFVLDIYKHEEIIFFVAGGCLPPPPPPNRAEYGYGF